MSLTYSSAAVSDAADYVHDQQHGEDARQRLTTRHIAVMTSIAQQVLGLDPDGKPGPLTRAAIEAFDGTVAAPALPSRYW